MLTKLIIIEKTQINLTYFLGLYLKDDYRKQKRLKFKLDNNIFCSNIVKSMICWQFRLAFG